VPRVSASGHRSIVSPEADAIAKGAASIQIDASLAALDFYRALVRRPPGRGDPSMS
jgi:hypothetical protein